MNEVKLANYTLMTVMLLTMATFCLSLNTLTKTPNIQANSITTAITSYSY